MTKKTHQKKLQPQLVKELQSKHLPWIGVDEVGRGCLAGPVCAGAVLFNHKHPNEHYFDSKSLSESQRETLAKDIQSKHMWALGWASVEEIDQVNIRQATFKAMNRAVLGLIKKYNLKETGSLLIDGRDTLPAFFPEIEPWDQLAIIKGDQQLSLISAASIVAKVARDQLMVEIAEAHPEYGFEKHKGYGTELHRKALEKFSYTTHHRKTFGGVKELIHS